MWKVQCLLVHLQLPNCTFNSPTAPSTSQLHLQLHNCIFNSQINNISICHIIYYKMNAFAFKRRSAHCQLKDPGLDCPNKDCNGWLNLFGMVTADKPTPAFFQCSNRARGCNQPTIFSKKDSTCEVCDEPIKLKDLITTSWDRKWIHFRCTQRSIQPDNIFAICLRCNENIEDREDSVPSNNGGVEGFIHKRCSKKRSLSTEDTDGEFTSSQGSL